MQWCKALTCLAPKGSAEVMAFPYATLCVQGIKDGTSRSSLEAQFEEYGKIRDVTITPNKHMRGVADSRLALVEFEKKEDARKAMQALNGRYVQGKCVMIRFARSAPGMRPPAPLPRHGAPELIPQTAGRASQLAQKFQTGDEEESDDAESRSKHGGHSGKREARRSRSRSRRGRKSRSRRRRSRSRRGGHSRSSPARARQRSRSRREHRGDRPRRGADGAGGEAREGRDCDRSRRSPSRWRPSSP